MNPSDRQDYTLRDGKSPINQVEGENNPINNGVKEEDNSPHKGMKKEEHSLHYGMKDEKNSPMKKSEGERDWRKQPTPESDTDEDWSSGFVTGEGASGGEPFTHIEEIYLSKSGFNRLFKAERYGRFHVLKALKEEFMHQPFAEQMLHKEFVISYPLDHPHICRTLAEERVPGLGHVLVQEYVDGVNLRQWMDQGEPTLEQARSLLLEICSAVSYLHNRQIIHRDIKPENVMVTRNGQHAKLIDFNLSDGDSFSQLKESAGTRIYMAPEVIEGESLPDQRADIYSLGILIGEMAQRLHDKELASLSRSCTKRQREERLPSAEAVMQRLTQRPRKGWKIGVVLLGIALLTGASLFIFRQSGAPQEPANLYPTYGNFCLSTSSLRLIEEQERIWQMKEQLTLIEMRQDSLQLIHRLHQTLDEEFPLPIQRQSKAYTQQWNAMVQEVNRICQSAIRSKRPQ